MYKMYVTKHTILMRYELGTYELLLVIKIIANIIMIKVKF